MSTIDDLIKVVVLVRPKEPIPTDIQPFTYLTREDFLSRHGASQDDLDAIAAFGTHRRLAVTVVDGLRRLVVMEAPYDYMRDAFGDVLSQVPPDLEGIIDAIIGLPPPDGPLPDPSTWTDAGNGHGLAVTRRQLGTPAALEQFYHFPDGDGAGECIAIVEMQGGYRKQDIRPFFQTLGISPQIEDVLVQSAEHVGRNRQTTDNDMLLQFIDWMNGTAACNEGERSFFEVTMDVSMIGALAPKADIKVYFGYDTVRALMYIIEEALFVRDPQPSVISISWGFQENHLRVDQSDINAALYINELFLAAAHMGVTICCSAGDWGASNLSSDGWRGTGCDVNFPASSPYVLACGGTTIVDDGSEVVWNADFPASFPDYPDPKTAPIGYWKHGATGGGYSKLFERPPWQSQVGNGGTEIDFMMRALPDVAAVADPHCGIRCTMAFDAGSGQLVPRTFPSGGTSAAAPMWAALVARLNQRLGRRVGCLNPILYAHVAGHPEILNDVTRGDNRFLGDTDVGFDARPGWDECTGLGTPNGEALLALLKSLLPAS
jgi:kumamolisin